MDEAALKKIKIKWLTGTAMLPARETIRHDLFAIGKELDAIEQASKRRELRATPSDFSDKSPAKSDASDC